MPLSVAVPARDEERYLAGCLESVRELADELLVVLDPQTRDRTAEIARSLGARVEEVPFVSFAHLRNQALDLCRCPWVFFLDADERATPELCREIATVIRKEPPAEAGDAVVGYWVPRQNFFFGRPVRHAGWYPDYQLRLLWKARARYPEAQRVHEVVELQGRAQYLSAHLLHYNVDQLAEFQAKQRRYARLEAETLLAKGIRARPRSLLGQPLREFWRRYVYLQGYRDGWLGLYLCAAMAYYTGLTYGHLLRMQRALPKT
ncbi:MAG: glycosyltransferase family 2 protein [Chloroflexia bacterium]